MKYIIGNQKNYLNNEEAINFVNEYKNVFLNNKIIVSPSSIYMNLFKNINIELCSQNVSFDSKNPYTGELNACQLKSFGINYCIVGHSERRINFNESNTIINKKINELLKSKIIPILCVGENYDEKKGNLTQKVITDEINNSLKNINFESNNTIIIAYEPIWAISNGINPSVVPQNDEISKIAIFIKKIIKENFNMNAIVLYGGSVNPTNVDVLNKIKEIDGYLIGGASKTAKDFLMIVEKCN